MVFGLKKFCVVLFVVFLEIVLVFPGWSWAFTTNISASIVIGQSSFTGSTANAGGIGASTLNFPTGVHTDGTRLYVADYSNNRVLIYNKIPTSSNTPADLVLGQADFVSSSINRGGSAAANTLRSPTQMTTAGSKLIVADYGNRRVLIWSQIPTTNGVAADIVVGQPNFTTTSSGVTSSKFGDIWGVSYDSVSGKMVICEYGNSRVLIFNSVPTVSGASADVVVGQPNFTSNSSDQGGSPGANTLAYPYTARIIDGKLFVTDTNNSRVLVWDPVPTTNNASASYVVGQSNFTANSANQGGSVSANGLNYPFDFHYDGKRLYVSDYNYRLLGFNGLPVANNVSGNFAIGQASLTAGSSNQGGVVLEPIHWQLIVLG